MTTNKEILEKAINKAIENGWEPFSGAALSEGVLQWFNLDEASSSLSEDNYKLFIFNHDFAKALWTDKKHGEDTKWGVVDQCKRCGYKDHHYECDGGIPTNYCWEYHLKRMVVADDPIQYLRDHI